MATAEKDWVAFEANFERGRSVRDTSTSRRSRSRSSRKNAWMDQPVSGDASWVPIAPPKGRAFGRRSDPSIGIQPINPPRRTKEVQRTIDIPEGPRPPSRPSRARSVASSGSVKRERSGSRPRRSTKSVSENLPVTSEGRQSRGRSLPRRSRSQARSVSSARSVPRRGRTSSRPPTTRVATERARSRSASLTRVTSPGAPPVLHSPSAKGGRPPTTSRSRQAARRSGDASSDGRPIIKDANIGRELSFGNDLTASSSGSDSSHYNGKNAKVSIREKLFGTQGDGSQRQARSSSTETSEIRPRILLAATVYHNTATNLWITTINTNQRGVAKNPKLANKYLKAFSFPTEKEARESAIANAPPKMIPFGESPACFGCHSKFAVFKRACHCRNCGVAICSNCTKTWPSKNLPETYNLKNEANLKVCVTCDSLSVRFRKALLQGEYEEAIALYGTGNINLRTPFATAKKEEVIYPVHAAVEGGNLKLLQWLMEDHFCPIQMKRSSKGGKASDSLIATSKGRTALSIAMQGARVDALRYLVVERGVSIFESNSLEHALRSLEAALVNLPREHSFKVSSSSRVIGPRWDQAYFEDDVSEPSSLGDEDEEEEVGSRRSARTKSSGRTKSSATSRCVICMDRRINCVATPCGHQVSCLACSTNLKTCPICNGSADFIRIFRA